MHGKVVELLELPRVSYKKVRVANLSPALSFGACLHLTLIKIDETLYVHTSEIARLVGQTEWTLTNLLPESYAECTQRFKCTQVTWETFANVCDLIGVEVSRSGELELMIYHQIDVLLKRLLPSDFYARVNSFLSEAIRIFYF
jgi:hypothetical protein